MSSEDNEDKKLGEASGSPTTPPPSRSPPKKTTDPYINEDTAPPKRFSKSIVDLETFKALPTVLKVRETENIAKTGEKLKRELELSLTEASRHFSPPEDKKDEDPKPDQDPGHGVSV